MKRFPTMTLIISATLLVASAGADHIPGHDDCDPTHPMPMPGQEFFDGGALFVTFIGPIEDAIVTNTTFDITYVSDGTTPAADLSIHISVQVDNDFAHFTVTGADLGFGSGPGTFSGSYQTGELNGLVWPSFFFPPYSIVDADVGSVNGGIQGSGYFVDSTITFDLVPPPQCTETCTGDLNGDGVVNPADLAELLAAWGPNPKHPADLDGNGSVGAEDLAVLLGVWGSCEEE